MARINVTTRYVGESELMKVVGEPTFVAVSRYWKNPPFGHELVSGELGYLVDDSAVTFYVDECSTAEQVAARNRRMERNVKKALGIENTLQGGPMDAGLQADINRGMGASFEARFEKMAREAGYYVQRMPDRVGFDYLVGDHRWWHRADGLLTNAFLIVECKCVMAGILSAAAFTPIELRTAEAIHAKDCQYYVAVPFVDDIVLLSWSFLRTHLLKGKRYTVGPDDVSSIWLRAKEEK